MALQATLLARLGAGAVSDYVSELSQLQQLVVRYTDGLHAALASLREIQTTNVAQNLLRGAEQTYIEALRAEVAANSEAETGGQSGLGGSGSAYPIVSDPLFPADPL